MYINVNLCSHLKYDQEFNFVCMCVWYGGWEGNHPRGEKARGGGAVDLRGKLT